jgi:predicted metalloprotease with PDZ domain
MRTTVFAVLALAVVTPLGAQSRHKVVMLNQDTLVTMEFGDAESCTVKIGERTLTDAQARDICATKRRSVMIATTTDGNTARVQLDELRGRLRSLGALDSSRVALLRQQESELARVLSRNSLALTEEAKRAIDVTTARPSERLFTALRAAEAGSIIGVTVDTRPRETDRWGAYVAGVTPGYPADRAGIRAGDIITRIDGQSLTSGRTERAATDLESSVWLRLSEIVRKLEPNKAVEVQYRRDDQTRTTRVTPIEDQRFLALAPGATTVMPDASAFEQGWRFSAPGSGGVYTTTPFPPGGNDAFFAFGSPIANLELAPVNEKLGAYFGTTRGVLVISAPEERNLSLEPGDVVTAIDGRTVDTPAEFIRALRSYERGKSFTLQVTRQKQRQSITTTLP